MIFDKLEHTTVIYRLGRSYKEWAVIETLVAPTT